MASWVPRAVSRPSRRSLRFVFSPHLVLSCRVLMRFGASSVAKRSPHGLPRPRRATSRKTSDDRSDVLHRPRPFSMVLPVRGPGLATFRADDVRVALPPSPSHCRHWSARKRLKFTLSSSRPGSPRDRRTPSRRSSESPMVLPGNEFDVGGKVDAGTRARWGVDDVPAHIRPRPSRMQSTSFVLVVVVRRPGPAENRARRTAWTCALPIRSSMSTRVPAVRGGLRGSVRESDDGRKTPASRAASGSRTVNPARDRGSGELANVIGRRGRDWSISKAPARGRT